MQRGTPPHRFLFPSETPAPFTCFPSNFFSLSASLLDNTRHDRHHLSFHPLLVLVSSSSSDRASWLLVYVHVGARLELQLSAIGSMHGEKFFYY